MTARLSRVTAAVVAGVVLLGADGASRAGWYDAVELPGTPLTSGELRIEEGATTVVRAGATVIVEATSRLHLAGDALAADLSLDVGSLTQADGAPPTGVTVRVVDDRGQQLDPQRGPWPVDEGDDGVTVAARIGLPIAAALALSDRPRVVWGLAQTAPGQGWSDVAVHEISLAGVWPTVPTFPAVGCARSSADAATITLFWFWDTDPPRTWEILERNSVGNRPRITQSIAPDGRVLYAADVDTQNRNWRYSVVATRSDGTVTNSAEVTRESCAVVPGEGA